MKELLAKLASQKRLFRALFVVFAVVIEYLATTSREIPLIASVWDKANHALAFFALYGALALGFGLRFPLEFALLLAFGAQIEIVQSFIPNRDFSLLDVVADYVGIIAGFLFVKYFRKNLAA